MSILEHIYDFIKTTVFNYDPLGELGTYASLIDAMAIITTVFFMFAIFVLIVRFIMRMIGKVGAWFGGRFY